MKRIKNAHRASNFERNEVKMIELSQKPVVVHERLKSEKKMQRKSSKVNSEKNGMISQVFHRQLGYLPQRRQSIVSYKNLSSTKKCEKVAQILSKQSEMVVKNSLLYRKLQLEYENMKKQLNKERAVLNRTIREIQLQISAEQRSVIKLREKKNKLIEQITTYTNELVDLQTRNYELYWEFCAQFEEVNEEYEDLLQMEQEIGSVNKGLKEHEIRILMERHKVDNTFLSDQKCCICCSELTHQKDIVQLECSHQYHAQCLADWLKISKMCPLCRKYI